jgi:hypothetical protein
MLQKPIFSLERFPATPGRSIRTSLPTPESFFTTVSPLVPLLVVVLSKRSATPGELAGMGSIAGVLALVVFECCTPGKTFHAQGTYEAACCLVWSSEYHLASIRSLRWDSRLSLCTGLVCQTRGGLFLSDCCGRAVFCRTSWLLHSNRMRTRIRRNLQGIGNYFWTRRSNDFGPTLKTTRPPNMKLVYFSCSIWIQTRPDSLTKI